MTKILLFLPIVILFSCSKPKNAIVFVKELEQFFIMPEAQAKNLSGSVIYCGGVSLKIPDSYHYFYSEIEGKFNRRDYNLKDSAVVNDCTK